LKLLISFTLSDIVLPSAENDAKEEALVLFYLKLDRAPPNLLLAKIVSKLGFA